MPDDMIHIWLGRKCLDVLKLVTVILVGKCAQPSFFAKCIYRDLKK